MAQLLQMTHFESKLNKALERVRVLLDASKTPKLAADVHHQYQDKFTLVETFTNAAAASQLNCLAELGLTVEKLKQLQEWAKKSSVSLRFRAEERCSFVREETREEEDPRKRVEEVSVGGAVRAAFTSKVVNKITEYFWKFEAKCELVAVRGVGAESSDRVQLLDFAGAGELKTAAKTTPRPEVAAPKLSEEVVITWLLRVQNDAGDTPQFKVDRSSKNCRTPRRNDEVEAALMHFKAFAQWSSKVSSYLSALMTTVPGVSQKFDFSAISPESVLQPVLPLMLEDTPERSDAPAQTPSPATSTLVSLAGDAAGNLLLPVADANLLLGEEIRTLREKKNALSQIFPADGLASAIVASTRLTLEHCDLVCKAWADAVAYVEDMLRKQLVAAIGKEVSPADFASYMTFHNRKLFKPEYGPKPFCYAVRRSERHSPEGTVSIEEDAVGPGGDSNISQPIVSICAKSSTESFMTMPLSASTTVSFGGDRYLHAYLSHQFSSQSGSQLSLAAKARQFSSFLVIVGRVASASSFEPKYAAIVQNKDELIIPLDLSTIPTPKEFKDAIESLSPEQQSFAKAFRAMQLESTLFGILVVQIKPQLEQVLNLADDSLTKEIKLTQDLMQLFIKYQIPTDLLSFDGNVAGPDAAEIVAASAADRLEAVKSHVKAMTDMIEQEKKEELEQRKKEAQYSNPFAKAEGPLMDLMSVELQCAEMAAPMMKSASRPASGSRGMMAFSAAAPAPPAMCCAAAAAPPPGPPSAVPPPPPPQQPQPQLQPPQQQQQQQQEDRATASGQSSTGTRDYTQVPKQMDEKFEKLDTDAALRPTIINPSKTWTKKAQEALLAKPKTSTLGNDEQKNEKHAAFDLLDALTKSGALPLTHASLHVVVAATHCFDKSVMETIVQDNMNPIEKVERSCLIMASTVHQAPPAALINEAHQARVNSTSPMLFLEDVRD
eukprot:TRINITY_DN3230_c0_g1_i1.p1 TRINITY_DN3230_c0_g1~~TRINITY_DN3230_c0_g1_i1.p1  ORF type:complete len:947 (-),score=250.40 TRINITY_DN3230_c0_g1_i1:101-2941(-)